MEARGGRLRRCALAAALLAGASVHAHDSWFAPARQPIAGATALELSTGTRYPVQEFNPTAASLVTAACVDAQGRSVPLEPQKEEARWLTVAARASGLLSCHAEMKAYDIQLEQRLVDVYLAEIRPPQPQREAWAAMQAAGQPWREQYRKSMRIELAAQDTATPQQRAAARAPRGLGLELVVLGDVPLAVNQPLRFQLLRDGRPLPGLAVEIVSERSKLGLWRVTDADGQLTQALPFNGRWLLRAVDLGLPQGEPPVWHSRFVTLAIELR